MSGMPPLFDDRDAAAGSRAGTRPDSRLADEAGFTLIELLVAAALSLLVLFAATAAMVLGLDTQNSLSHRAVAIQTLETAAARMTTELRGAAAVTYVSGGGNVQLQVTPPANVTPPAGTQAGQAVTFNCQVSAGTPGSCLRQIGGGTVGTFTDRITNTNVFTLYCRTSTGALLALANGGSLAGCSTGIDYVQITLVRSVSCTGQAASSCPARTIQVEDGTAIRNQA